MISLKFSTTLLLSLLVFGFYSGAKADDKIAKEKLAIAEKLYLERDQNEKLDQAIETIQAAAKEASDKDLKFDIDILHAKLVYFKGNRSKTDKEKKVLFLSSLDIAKGARANGDYAESYFWEAASLSRYAKVVGFTTIIFRKKELLGLLDSTNKKKTKDGKEGEAYEGYGATRILGKMHYELPAQLGGDYPTAMKYLKTAFEKAPEYASNVHYYSEAQYASTDVTTKAKDKAEAKARLEELLKKDPRTYNPNRIPETMDEFEAAKKTLATMKK